MGVSDTVAYLTNKAYGYPNRGDARRIPARRLACLHVTSNPSDPPATAMQERTYANRTGSDGPSAHSYLDRDGSFVHAIHPALYAAWSNGILRSPKTTTPGVSEVVALVAKGYNANEDYYREIESCGRYSAYPITAAQRESISRIIAEDAIATGLPINRSTVHLHSDLDSVNRPNCPVPASGAEAWVTGIISRANQIYLALKESDMTWEELFAALDAEYKKVVAERDALAAANAELRADLDIAKQKAQTIEVYANEIQAL